MYINFIHHLSMQTSFVCFSCVWYRIWYRMLWYGIRMVYGMYIICIYKRSISHNA